jgi:hypothetical protein
MNVKRVRALLPSILCLLTAPMIRADVMTSVDLSGQVLFLTNGIPPESSTPIATCGATGTSVASCSQTESVTIDGVSVPITVSGTAEAENGLLSITSQDSTTLPNNFFLVDNNLISEGTASFDEDVLVPGPANTSGFLQFILSFGGGCPEPGSVFTAAALINGQSYSLGCGSNPAEVIDLPVEFDVPFLLNVSLEIFGDIETEDAYQIENDVELEWQPLVIPAPEASSWWLLLTAALFIAPAIRQRFNLRL